MAQAVGIIVLPIHFSKLTQFIRAGVVSAAVSICALFGFCGSTFGCGPGIAPTNWSTWSVLRAAPWRYIPFREDMEQFSHLNWPPAYVSKLTCTVQPLQSNPSNCCIPPLLLPDIWNHLSGIAGLASSSAAKNGPKAFPSASGTDGTAGSRHGGDVWANKRCTKVELWMPNVQADPSANDNTNGAYIRITPPSGKAGNCSIWEYRDGESPPLKTPPSEKKQQPIIPPKGKKAVPKQPKRDPSNLLPSRV